MKLVLWLVMAACLHTPLLAQDTVTAGEVSKPPTITNLYRDPHKARILGSVFPGAGHIYAGEYFRGYIYYLTTVGDAGMGALIYSMNGCSLAVLDPSCHPGPEWPYHAVGIAMVGAGIWTWISSARDAAHAAERANVRHQPQTFSVNPVVRSVYETGQGVGVGLSVSW